MPFKTMHGHHYHMIEGCYGATIPCDTKGLEPCSECCGGNRANGGQPILMTGTAGIPAGGTVAGDSMGTAEAIGDAVGGDTWDDSVRAMVSEAAFPFSPDGIPWTSPQADAGVAEPFMAAVSMSTPDGARSQLGRFSEVIGEDWLLSRPAPRPEPIGASFRFAMGKVTMAVSDFKRRAAANRERRALMRSEGISSDEARALMAIRRERYLDDRQHLGTMGLDVGVDINPGMSRDVIAADHVRAVTRDVCKRYGIVSEKQLSATQCLMLSHEIQAAIEETGFADKLTPKVVASIVRNDANPREFPTGVTNTLMVAVESTLRDREYRLRQVELAGGLTG